MIIRKLIIFVRTLKNRDAAFYAYLKGFIKDSYYLHIMAGGGGRGGQRKGNEYFLGYFKDIPENHKYA